VVSAELDLSADLLSVAAENVIWLQQLTLRSRLHRVISVPKMRYSAHDVTLREFVIAPPAGIRVLDPLESGPDVLAGVVVQHNTSISAPGASEVTDSMPSGPRT
jgi:circadian clock protein KaiC